MKNNQYLNLLLDKHGLIDRITLARKYQPSVQELFKFLHKKIFKKIIQLQGNKNQE